MFGRIARTGVKIQARNAVPEYRPDLADQQLRGWTARLNSLASSPASRMYLTQLSALMNYYNRQVTDNTQQINWSEWNSKIITQGLVDKVRNNFEELNQESYDLDRIFNDIFSRDSKAVDEINNQMAFHTAIWLDNYADYVSFLSDLDAVSSPKDYSTLEYYDMHPGAAEKGDALMETHNYLPGVKSDVNLYVYMGIQFAWGKKFSGFYRHPADDFKGGRATKNTMGR